MFQSLWNVAAAFCDHENAQVSSQSFTIAHFGHHVAPNCAQDQQQHANQSSILDQVQSETFAHDPQNFSHQNYSDQNHSHQNHSQLNDFLNHLEDDHSDHLPSFAHFIAVDVQQQAEQAKFTAYPESAFIDWHNLYQSPHLFLNNPPPVLSPL